MRIEQDDRNDWCRCGFSCIFLDQCECVFDPTYIQAREAASATVNSMMILMRR